ncbi:ABC transporter ATP-binding protein [Verrucosispora sp. WMMD703]|uniref:ABC transporter n=1 Tax=Micromonospora sediminimaris TaxID=547162 RepID=A0A9W5UV60_9ACTN|nr:MULTISPECIES: ABC transporter ATP-binding protein [Micromonospora]WFE43648.1 ABC transporter ATP-binding protein [Verrucosispora sp. WMMD1129]GIJ34808.1 ABC transporter [Micromonospora sediminimaris]SFD51841.1 ATP-binding cassette, subfamily B [Micromonospora sediminimaris]
MADRTGRAGTLGWLSVHLRPQGWLLLLFTVATVAAHLLATLIPLYVGRAFDELTRQDPALTVVVNAALVIAALGVGRFLADLLSAGSMEIVAQRVKRDARDQLFRSLLDKGQAFHDRQRIGDILARTINDARLVDYLISPGVATAFNGVIALAIPIIFIATMRAELLLAPALLVTVFTFALWRHVRRLHPLTRRLRRRFTDLNEQFSETLTGMATVQASGQERNELAKFDTAATAYRDAYVRRGHAQAVYLPALGFGLGMAAGAVHSLALFSAGELALAQVITYLGWLGLFAVPISMSEQSVPVIQEGYVACARMHELTDADSDQREQTGGTTAMVTGSVTFDRVSFTYQGRVILRDVSFHLPAGRTLAVVGPTGSGKTMLTKLVNRTYDVTGGRVLIDGRDISDWQPGALRRQIGNVHQDAFLFSKSVFDNVAFGVHRPVSSDEVSKVAQLARADGFIRQLPQGYDTVLNEGGSTLSGGQRQRLVISRALIADPPILTLDDATSAIDARTAQEITDAIDALTTGRTTILVSHRPDQIRRADLILVLDRGEVAGLGSHAELIDHCALYQEIYR